MNQAVALEQESHLLARVPVLDSLGPAERKLLCFASERMVHEPGQAIVRQGEPADAAYVIIEGAAQVGVALESRTLVLATLGRHCLFGEIGILCDAPHTASVTAITRLETLRIPADVFRQIVHSCPGAALSLSRLLSRQLMTTTAALGAVAN